MSNIRIKLASTTGATPKPSTAPRNAPKCSIHHVPLISFCPACRGAVKSKKKAVSSRENGKLGGRPLGSKDTKSRARAK